MTKKLIDAVTNYTAKDLSADYNEIAVPLDEFISKLQVINNELVDTNWQDIKILIGLEYDYEDCSLMVQISGKRPETDKEERQRLKTEERIVNLQKIKTQAKAEAIKRKETSELAELARLKAKYDK